MTAKRFNLSIVRSGDGRRYRLATGLRSLAEATKIIKRMDEAYEAKESGDWALVRKVFLSLTLEQLKALQHYEGSDVVATETISRKVYIFDDKWSRM